MVKDVDGAFGAEPASAQYSATELADMSRSLVTNPGAVSVGGSVY